MKRLFLNQILSLLTRSGSLDLYQRCSGRNWTVLLYHSVASGPHNSYLDVTTFKSHMDVLSSEFNVLSADEFLWHRQRNKRFPPRSVLITFDDGFRNNYKVVHPIMKKRDLPWILFTTTQSLEKPDEMIWPSRLRAVCLFTPPQEINFLDRRWFLKGNHRARLRMYKDMNRWISRHSNEQSGPAISDFLKTYWRYVPEDYIRNSCSMITESQLRELVECGQVEIGAHTRSHPFLTTLSDQQLSEEIDQSAGVLSEIVGQRIRMFAYPSGRYGEREVRKIASLGFDCAFAVMPTLKKFPQYEIPRIGIYDPGLSALRAKSLGLAEILRKTGVRVG